MMKRVSRLFYLYFLAIWTFSAWSQSNPTTYAIEAQKLAKYGKIAEAISKWKLDYAISNDHRNAYEIAALYAIAQSNDSAFVLLYEASQADSSLSIFEDDRFYSLIETSEWLEFVNQQVGKYELKNGKFKNIILAKKLWHIGMKDQAYSYEINLAERTLGDTSPITRALWKLQELDRKENLAEMEAIIDKYGWPKISDVGEAASEKAFWVVQHSMSETARKKYLPALKKACKKNEALWGDYATMYDRLSLAETGKQLYGTQMHRAGFNGQIELLPLESPEYVEKRRREVNLPPLIPVLEKHGIPFYIIQKE